MNKMGINNNFNSKYDYFISFSNKDIEKVNEIVYIIENVYHAKCWFQAKDSKAEFIDTIMEGIENSRSFLVFISPDSANSYFVLNEINHAIEFKEQHDDYNVLPIFITPDIEYTDPVYKRIRFYLGRLNILFLDKMPSLDALVLKIFEQTDFEIDNEKLMDSLYHTSDSEAKRLKAQNEIMKDFSKDFFDDTVKQDSIILDVGCASGDYIISQLQERQYSSLLGIDLDPNQIDCANNLYGSEKNTFICCDVLSNDFDNVLSDYLEDRDSIGFDLIHISSMLLHTAEPVRILRILKRFLKRNGKLFIQDEDDGANLVYPNSKFFDLAFSIWADSKESGDRHCARKIPSYLAEAGYSRVKLAKCGVSNPGMSNEHKSALWDIYFNHYLWIAADKDENMFIHTDITNKLLEEYKTLYEEYKKQYDEGNIFIQLGFFFYIAQK